MAQPRRFEVVWHKGQENGETVPVVVFRGMAGGARDAILRVLAKRPMLPPAHLLAIPLTTRQTGGNDPRTGDDLLATGFQRHRDPELIQRQAQARAAVIARQKAVAQNRNEALRRRQLALYPDPHRKA